MSPWETVVVALAGVAAGGINAVVGSGTLVTFPALLASGLTPLSATITNSLGLVPGNLAGAVGYRRELRGLGPLVLRLLPASVLGALTGAYLLLHLPAAAFGAVVPVLVALAVVLVATQPLIAGRLARRHGEGPPAGSSAGSARAEVPTGAGEPLPDALTRWRLAGLLLGALATGTYGGYFAASQGVLQIGVFGLLLRLPLQRLNAIKNVLTLAVNAVAAAAYVVTAAQRIDWTAAGLVAAGSFAGAWAGARFGRRLPAVVLRAAVVVLGVVSLLVLVR
ncbi:sulfite exporter TauE/SafE family protein [Kineococcus esterisolvens]|uniref:sulfite exporter TauE/SafE family protein n=1 Tax=unclassified Kineococcus TaxID=2621656 RepID=UPI003D7D0F25